MHRLLSGYILLFILLPQFAFTQITAPFADLSDTAAYAGGKPDSLFVFNAENPQKFLLADTSGYSSHLVEWDEYIPGTGFQPFSAGELQLNIANSPFSQGYRLRLVGTPTLECICWVMINESSVEILTKNPEGVITRDALTSSDCIAIGYIEVEYKPRKLEYFNPTTSDTLTYSLSYKSSSEISPQPDAGFGILNEADPLNGLLRFSINNSWWKDASYIIKITDKANLVRQDTVLVTAIRPYADFKTPEHIPLNDRDYYPGRDTLYYRAYGENYTEKSAPGLYSFESGAFNFDSIVYHFGDSVKITTEQEDTVYAYQKWGVYEAWIEVVNYFDFRRECYYTSDKINLELSKPSFASSDGNEVQNVFSPPNGSNPIWRLDDVSIIDFEIAIYNRYGRRIHYFKGNIRDWGGWDGRINNSSSYVATGVYFYVIKEFSTAPSFGTTESVDLGDVKKGAIHVFNTE